MDYEEMKLECLKIAMSQGLTGKDLTDQAARLYDFCRDRGEFSPFKRGLTEPVLQNDKVRVVGKDGDLPDYVKE